MITLFFPVPSVPPDDSKEDEKSTSSSFDLSAALITHCLERPLLALVDILSGCRNLLVKKRLALVAPAAVTAGLVAADVVSDVLSGIEHINNGNIQ